MLPVSLKGTVQEFFNTSQYVRLRKWALDLLVSCKMALYEDFRMYFLFMCACFGRLMLVR